MPERVLKRGGTYYFRAKYPADLRHHFQAADRWKSLRTKNLPEARLRVRVESLRFDAEMAELRKRIDQPLLTKLSRAEIDAIAAAYLHELMLEDEEMRVEGLTGREYRSAGESVAIVGPVAKRDAAIGNVAPYREEFEDWLASNGHRIDPNAPIYREVLSRMLREFVKHLDGVAERQAGNFVDTPPAPVPAETGPSVRQLIDDYLSDPAASRNSKTQMTYRIVFDALAEIVGEHRPARDVSRADCERVRDVLLRLPSNARKKYPGVPLLAAVELGAKDGAPVLGPGTVNNYLNNLAALFNWAVETWRIVRNPAKGLSVHDPVPAGKKRDAFPENGLLKLFQAPLYTGCIDDQNGYAKPGPQRPRHGRFWVPLLALFHGLRLSEACQLLVADVQEIGGVPVLMLTDDMPNDMDVEDRKRIKTEAGKRYVPLHPEVMKIGFLDFVSAAREAKQTRLFPELKKDAHGYYSQFSKWFARFLEKAGVKTKKVTFHSFRHSYRDALRRAKAPRDVAQALGGWASQGTDDDYGDGLGAAFLADYVGRVAFPHLDLTHLCLCSAREITSTRSPDNEGDLA
jgi:integrase